ncbi:ATP-binding protein [Ulvibacter antarcticus]|uniref:histidine kinase n=1 Tax=Ulvibacter antarcticus TaxID=442714 RepID=A0A3L9YE43_9FLAO|nr:ATP-binding protein [Ulvibacter antarcticus]RMA57720.1 PAS domain S-box-containing protein [Ulvibacter antarcticus]
MSTLINRFFSQNAPTIEKSNLIISGSDSILDYFINKGSSCKKFNDLAQKVRQYQFPEQDFKSNLADIYLYLEIEDYLIYHDPRCITSKVALRKEITINFSDIASKEAFRPLFETGRNQEIILGHFFISYILQSFQALEKSNKLASRWLGSINSTPPILKNLDLVGQINSFRKLKENLHKIYVEFLNSFGKEFSDAIFYNALKDFNFNYHRLESKNTLKEMIPQGFFEVESIPVKNGSESPEIKVHIDTKKAVAIDNNSVLEYILDGYILINQEGNVIDNNSNALQIFGLQKEALKNKSIFDLLSEEIAIQLRKDLFNPDPAIPKNIIGTRLETELQKSNGITDDYEIAITNNYSSPQDTYSIFLKNITNKKDTLKSVREAKINAERMAKAKSTFLSNMSHEIRTPLNVILGLSEIITKSDHKNESLLRKNVDGINFSAKSLLSIVNDILDFSKIEAGKLTLQAIDFNLRDVVENLANGFEIKAKEKGLKLEAFMDKDIPDIVIGDQYRLNQILTNLIGNSIKFTQEGQITINILKVAEDDSAITLNFQVKDTGIGIPEDKLENIFDSFYQVENPENSKITGTGLGLAITKELIYLQEGTLDASSEVGVGSVFEFSIPLKKSKLKKITNTVKYSGELDLKLNNLRVLVAEDNQMNQFYIKQLLNGLNVEVDIAENGQEAVEIFKNSKTDYDIVFMDMHMPVMNGLEAISIIRKSNKNSRKKIPIVACSADVFPEARKNAIKAGIDFYLTKPLNEDAVKEVLFWLISDEDFNPNTPSNTTGQDVVGAKSSTIDINMLLETFDNDEEFIISLLEVFIKETPEDYKSLRSCMEREYYSRASSLAHKMKSSFMNLGMTLLGHHLQQIESNTIKNEGLNDAKKHMTAFNSLYTKALLEINIILIELRQH